MPRVPSPVRGVNVYSLPLSTVEGFVLSRVDGAASVEDISIMSGIDQTKVLAILERLAELGAVQLSWFKPKVAPKPPLKPEAPSRPPDAHFGTEPPRHVRHELDEDVEIAMDARKRILIAFHALEGRTNYELLGVKRDADKKAIRNAYFEMSKLFHPDAYFGKRLGSYKSKMETVFKRLTEAYEVLGKAKKRAEYDEYLAATEHTRRAHRTLESIELTDDEGAAARAHAKKSTPKMPSVDTRAALRPPPVPSVGGSAPAPRGDAGVEPPPAATTLRPQSTAERRARVRDRLRQRMRSISQSPNAPSSQPVPDEAQRRRSVIDGLRSSIRASASITSDNAQLQMHVQRARDAEQAGDVLSAATQLQLALAIEPNNAQLIAEYERVSKVVARNLADNYEKQAAYEEKTNNWQAAAKSWMRVSDGRPEEAEPARRAAEAMLKARFDLHRAQKYAQKAVSLDAKNVQNLTVLARVYLAAGLKLNALRELERAAQLAPKDEMVNNLLREAR